VRHSDPAATQQFRFPQPVLPGQTLEIELTLGRDFGAVAWFDGLLRIGANVAAQGELTMSCALSSSV
jgi:3-hydroxymyristoyl/3-hydroxydecanoyl-(acyl carrier protein) dehydratase